MQRHHRVFDSSPETVEATQGSSSNNVGMSERSTNNFLTPAENPSNIPASYNESSHLNPVNQNTQIFSQWTTGESSSRVSPQNQDSKDGAKMEERWAPSVNNHANSGQRSEERRYEQNGIFLPRRSSIGIGSSTNASTNFSSDVGPSGSSGYLMEETSSGSGGWGLSCKRKALEGTSNHSSPGGSSSSFPPQPENVGWHTSGSRNNASSSLSLSPPSQNSPLEPPHTRIGLATRGLPSENLPSSGVSRLNAAPESLGLNLSSGWSIPQPFRTTPTNNLNGSEGPLHGMQASATSRSFPFPRNRSSNSRAGNSSGSFAPRERVASIREEIGSRPMFVPVNEMRYMGQDPSGWSLSTGNAGPSSSNHPPPTASWLPHNLFSTPPSQPRFSEFAPWSLFPSVDSEPGGRNGHFPHETVVSSGSGGQGHNRQTARTGFLMEGQGDDVLGMPRSLRALAADIEGRHRFISEIRQVLDAMRRGENLRNEDYMLFDPFIHHGMAEMHDRHRDMRLDVDNMSYEELLALEERIGDVSTGLTEGTILKLMKQTKYFLMATESRVDVEPCSICQEEYINGDELGKLECGHDFHTNCIKQWLMLKNLCPICKTTALPT